MKMMKIFNESGKGYWMEGFGCLRAEGENRPSRPGHIVILNDQGGSVMDTSEDVTATLRAQEHGHCPIVCYAIEGNVVDRVSAKNGKGWCENVSPTLNTQDRHAVCFAWANSASAELSCGEISPTIKASRCGEPAVCIAPVLRERPTYSVDCRNLYLNEEKSGTLQAKNVGGFSYNYLNPVLKEKT